MPGPTWQDFLGAPLVGPGEAGLPRPVPKVAPKIFTRQDALDGLAMGKSPQEIRSIVAANGDEMSDLADALLREREGGAPTGGAPAGATSSGPLTTEQLIALLGGGGGGGREFAPPTAGISLSEALAIQESERAKGNVVQILTHSSGLGYDIVSTSTPPPPPPARTGFATPEEAYAATPSGLALGQLTGTPTTGFMPTYVNREPTQGISLSEALAIQESERAKGNVVQILTHSSGLGYDIVSTSTPPPARTGFATPEEAYAATPSGLALGQLTGTPTTGFMPTYVNEAPSPFQQQQFADKQAQDAINNELQKSQMRLNAYINMGNQQAAAQEANYKSRLGIRAQALAERTAGLDPMLQMGRETGYYPARAIMEMAGRALPEMPSPLNIEVPSSEAVLAAAGIPLAARPPGASPGASTTMPPTSQMMREELAARLFRGMR